MRRISLLLALIFGLAINGQANELQGTWKLNQVLVKESSSEANLKVYGLSELPDSLKGECLAKIEVQASDNVTVNLADNQSFKVISFSLTGDELTISFFPGHLATYKVEHIGNTLTLSRTSGSIEYVYTYSRTE